MKRYFETIDEFDPQQFQRVLSRYFLIFFMPLFVGMFVMGVFVIPKYGTPVDGSMLVEMKGLNEPTRLIGPFYVGGISMAFLAFGGLAVGVIAIGGAAIGVIAIGGGAVGLIAIGGGAVGAIAIGGGAMGFIAIGGGASGVFVLGGSGKGRYVLSYERHDIEAIRFFCRWLPGLRSAFGSSADI